MISATGSVPGNRNSKAPFSTDLPRGDAAANAEEDTVTLSERARLLASRSLSAEEQRAFAALVARAAAEGGDDPFAFLDGLTVGERALLQKVHCLAGPLDSSRLSAEGAANLLRYPREGLDSDNDGFVAYGAARLFEFPPPGAPAGVKAAWARATDHMSDDERGLAAGLFLPLSLQIDAAGAVGERRPGDAGYAGPFSGAGFSWSGLVQQRLEGLEVTRQYGKISDAQYLHDRALLLRFADGLKGAGVGP